MSRSNRTSVNVSRGSGRVSQTSRSSRKRMPRSGGLVSIARRDGTALIRGSGVYNYAGPKGSVIRISPAQGVPHHHDEPTAGRPSFAERALAAERRGSRTLSTSAGRQREHARNKIARQRGWALPNGKLPVYRMTAKQRAFFQRQNLLPSKTNRAKLLGGDVPGAILMPRFQPPGPVPGRLAGGQQWTNATPTQQHPRTLMGPYPTPKPPGAHPGKPVVTPVPDRIARFFSLLHRRPHQFPRA